MRRVKIVYVAAFVCCLFASLISCGKVPESCTDTFFGMDTIMEVTVYGDADIFNDIREYVKSIEKLISTTDSESEIYKLNAGQTDVVSDVTYHMIEDSLDYCQMTDGALDISVYPVVKAWGFTTDEKRVPSKEELVNLLGSVDYSEIKLSSGGKVSCNGAMIDLGSVAKGYVSDNLVSIISNDAGIDSAIVTLGGNVQTIGRKPDGSLWKVAIADPMGREEYIGYVSVENKAVITSGTYQRFFEENGKKYHHIIDPASGYPVDNGLISVTVVGDSGFYCDALSTALFVKGLDGAIDYYKEHKDFEAIFIEEDGTVLMTPGLKGTFTVVSGKAKVVGDD